MISCQSLDQKSWYRKFFKVMHVSQENIGNSTLPKNIEFLFSKKPVMLPPEICQNSFQKPKYASFLKPRGENYSTNTFQKFKPCVRILNKSQETNTLEGSHRIQTNPPESSNNRFYFSGNNDWSASIKGSANYARVLYPFKAEHPRELSLKPGEIVRIIQPIDNYWLKGTNSIQSGIFPLNRVKFVDTVESQNMMAIYSFSAEHSGELSFDKGDIIEDVVDVDDNWMEGILNGLRGIFPRVLVKNLNYETKELSRPQQILGNLKPTHKVIYEYQTKEFDELDVVLGELLTVMERFNDGWCYGISHRTGSYGVFPGTCIRVI